MSDNWNDQHLTEEGVRFPRAMTNDKRLSLGALGICMYIISFPSANVHTIDSLAASNQSSIAKVQRLIKELASFGYVDLVDNGGDYMAVKPNFDKIYPHGL